MKIGTIVAIFHLSENIPVLIDCLNIYDNYDVNTNNASGRHTEEISLNPEDLQILIFLIDDRQGVFRPGHSTVKNCFFLQMIYTLPTTIMKRL